MPECREQNPAGAKFGRRFASEGPGRAPPRTGPGYGRVLAPPPLTARVILLVLAALVVARAVAGPVGVAAQERQDWRGHLERAESAASRRDVASALKAIEQAYVAALETGRWEGVIEYADAVIRLRDRAGLGRATDAKAREAYSIALRRARDGGSVEGMLRSAEGFARLRDFEALAYAARLIELFEAQQRQVP